MLQEFNSNPKSNFKTVNTELNGWRIWVNAWRAHVYL
ncbi:Trp operon leader peptide [Vibrio cincinnatiensis]|nr:Trp operon leader peptide [Vibrio cincinnatiensis]MCG3728200.1 Trp operon leader peptide [Vibrio cincinnatiensis]